MNKIIYLCSVKIQNKLFNSKTSNVMSTLNQQINNIFETSTSMAAITRSLRALGIEQREINNLFFQFGITKQNSIENITFGVEIECYNVEREEIAQRLREAGVACYVEGYNHRDHRDHFKVVTDASLTGLNTAEVVSPILKGKKGMQTLETVCKVLNEINAKVNKSCGLHVHFGLDKVDFKTYQNIFYNYAKIESVIDSFMPRSRRDNNYCKGFRNFGNNIYELISAATTKDEIANIFCNDRYYKVNPVAYARHNTIEFRQHSGTTDFEKMSNWIEFLKALIEFSKKHRLAGANDINDLPFINSQRKSFFNARKAALA